MESGKSRVLATFVGGLRTTAWHAVSQLTSEPKKRDTFKHTAADPNQRRPLPSNTGTKQSDELDRLLLFNWRRPCAFVKKVWRSFISARCSPARGPLVAGHSSQCCGTATVLRRRFWWQPAQKLSRRRGFITLPRRNVPSWNMYILPGSTLVRSTRHSSNNKNNNNLRSRSHPNFVQVPVARCPVMDLDVDPCVPQEVN